MSANETNLPPRPKQAPEDAVWDADDKVFRAGPLDAQGQKQGLWRAFYPSGIVSDETTYDAGLEHGPSWCARGEDGESPFDDTFATEVARVERVYERGVLMRERCFTQGGELVGADGKPLPERAEAIPATATWLSAGEMWVDGPISGPMTGRQRLWNRTGEPLSDAAFVNGERHGKSLRYQYGSLTVASDLQGPPLTHLVDADYENGELLRVVFSEQAGSDGGERDESKNGDEAPSPKSQRKPLATAHFRHGRLHGKLFWNVERHISLMKPVLTFRDTEVTVGDLFGKKRVRGLGHVEAEYEDGKLASLRNFDAKGNEILPPKPIEDFGQTMDREKIPGYIARGDLARDLAEFFPTEKPSSIDEDAARAEEVFAALPEEHRAAAKALDAIARAMRFPLLETTNLEAYGFDTVKNELYQAEDARYFGLAYDGMGNMQFLDTETGKVLGYEHEEGIFQEKRTFGSLDEWAFAMVRVELVATRRVAKAAVKELFTRLDLRGGLFELNAVSGD